MEVAMLFPGQASQYVGMGKDYYDKFAVARKLYREANSKLGFDITELSFSGDMEELTRTNNAQPAIVLHSMVVLAVLGERGIKPKIVSGHSLGEFSALVSASFFRAGDALLIVRRRGELMFEAGMERPGTMAAVIGIEKDVVQGCIEEASSEGVVVIANCNSPLQFAISGEIAAVEKAMSLARSKGAKRVVRLKVSGAFHSPLMEPTAAQLVSYMEKFERGRLEVPWISNVTGTVVKSGDEVLGLLSKQLFSPVLWVDCMLTLLKSYSGPILEVGPGKVLTGLMGQIREQTKIIPLSRVEDLENAARRLG